MFRTILNTKYVLPYYIKIAQKSNAIRNTQRESIEAICKVILDSVKCPTKDWSALRNQVLDLSKGVSSKAVDLSIINTCIDGGQHQQAKNYINYLKKQNLDLNLGTIGKCFELHHILHSNKLTTEQDEEDILLMYKDLLEKYPLLDSITSRNVILGLSVTKEWKECLKLLEDMKISGVPAAIAYNTLISAAFFNNDYDTGWKFFKEMIANNRLPAASTYLTYLDTAVKDTSTKELIIDNLLNFVASYDLEFNEDVALKLFNITKNKSKLTHISKSGICRCCGQKLQERDLSPFEFEQLRKSFFDNVIIGKDVFLKTNPNELARFTSFVGSMEKFDVIVDGLNVAYASGTKQSLQVQSTILASVINHFITQNKKVLVIGRAHMERFPKYNWHFIKRNATVFLLEDISQDDPYLLYCGLHTGVDVILVTRDLMRSHLYRLKGSQNKLLFNRWLAKSRYSLIHANMKRVIFKAPVPYMIMPQYNKNHWHVPYIVQSDGAREPVYKWLCISR